MDVLYNFGFKYDNPDKPYDMEGFVNSADAVAGLEFYKALYDCCTPPGIVERYMGEGIDAFKSGQVAMQMNFAFIWPGVRSRSRTSAATRPATSPTRPVRTATSSRSWAGRAFRSSPIPTSRRRAGLHQVVRPAGSAGEMVVAGRLFVPAAVVEDPGFATSQPYAQTFLDSMAIVKDFWAEPPMPAAAGHAEAVPRLCRGRQRHRQEALDGLVADWTEVFEDEGKL